MPMRSSKKINIKLAATAMSTAIALQPYYAFANGAAAEVAAPAGAAAVCKVALTTAEDKAVEDFGNLFQIDTAETINAAIKGLELKKVSLVEPLGVSDKEAERAKRNEEGAKLALAKVLASEASPEQFQAAMDLLSKQIRGALNVKEAERLSASKLLDTKLSEMKAFDEKQRLVEGDMKSLLEQLRKLNPDVAAKYKGESFAQRTLGKIPVIGSKMQKSAAERANELYERTTSARQGINDAIGAVKAGGVLVNENMEILKEDRIALIKLLTAYEQRTAILISLDKVFWEYLRDSTKETDAIREYFTTEIIKPIRQILLDIESMKDSVNTALMMNFSLVQRGQHLVDRTGRMTERLTVDFFTTIATKIAMDQQIRQAALLNDAEVMSARMKMVVAEDFQKLGIEIRNEENILDQVTKIIADKNALMQKEVEDMEAYDQRITSKLAAVIKDRTTENERMKTAILRMEKGEAARGVGAAEEVNTLAHNLRAALTARAEAIDAIKTEAKK